MKVLIVNWSWYPTGGDWTYIYNLINLYEQNGVEVLHFSTKNAKNVESRYKEYFADSVDYKAANRKKDLKNLITVSRNSIVNENAVRNLNRLLDDHPGIDVAHLHNINHHITPAVIPVLKKRNIRVVWSLHDYKILCPDSSFVSKDKVCENCFNKKFYHCTLQKCKKGSLAGSMLATIEAYYYSKKKVYDQVDAFLCPSSFIKNKFVEFGYDAKKLHVTNLCYDIKKLDDELTKMKGATAKEVIPAEDRFILFIGRIEKIKGIFTLCEALKGTGIKLKIVGGGSDELLLAEYLKNNPDLAIEYLGFKDKSSVYDLTVRSEFLICPSEWYENFPFSIIESFLMQKAVIGASIGGIPELVIDGVTGSIFPSGNTDELKKKIVDLWESPGKAEQMGINARKHVEALVSFEQHWAKISGIFRSLNIEAKKN